MHKKCKFLLLISLAIMPLGTLFSQNRTYSPFSRYGIGDISQKGFGRNTGMGGTGIGLKSSYHLNNLNPASYASLDTFSFYFESGLSGFSQNFESAGQSAGFANMNFDYFAIAFPITKRIFTSVGIVPGSSAGYTIQDINDGTLFKANGFGNNTNLYAGMGIRINSNWAVGAHANYWFGNITHVASNEYLDDGLSKKFGFQTKSRTSDVLFDFGLQYSNIVGKNNQYTLGFTFNPKTSIQGESTRLEAEGTIYEPTEGGLFHPNDTTSFTKNNWNNNAMEFPLGFGVGGSFVFNNQLVVAADYSSRLWSDANFPDDLTYSEAQTTNASYYNFGLEWTPNDRTGKNYLTRIRYRAGLRYTEDYIKYNGYQIKDFGMSFGLGLPLKRSNTSVNMNFEYGKKGTAEPGQIKETYTRLTLNFTMHEYWFFKRKFD